MDAPLHPLPPLTPQLPQAPRVEAGHGALLLSVQPALTSSGASSSRQPACTAWLSTPPCANEHLPGSAAVPEPGGQCDLCDGCIPATVLCSHGTLGVPGRAPPAAEHPGPAANLAWPWVPCPSAEGPAQPAGGSVPAPAWACWMWGQATSGLSFYSHLLFLREAKPASKE